MNRMKRSLTHLLILVVVSVSFSACASGNQAGEVRPLVNLDDAALKIAKYDDASLQARLERLVGEVAPIARTAGGWGRLTTDLLNPEVLDVVFVGSERATLNFGYGTEAASMLSREDHVILAMAGDTGSCWAVRVSGSYDDPQVLFGNTFAPNCSADKLGEHSVLECSIKGTCPAKSEDKPADEIDLELWFAKWPPTATPTATGPDGLEIGDAPAEPTG